MIGWHVDSLTTILIWLRQISLVTGGSSSNWVPVRRCCY